MAETIPTTGNYNNKVHIYNNFEVANVTVGPLIKNRMGGHSVNILYDNMRRILLQTPSMPAPFGISEFTTETGVVKYSVDLSFRYENEDSKVARFRDKLEQLDEKMIELATINSVKWFGKKLSREVIAELYRPLIKLSKQPEKYKPLLKCKLRSRVNGEMGINAFDVHAFTCDGDVFDMATFMPGGSIKLIVEIMPVWFMNRQFGLSLNIVQVEMTQLPPQQACRDNGFLTGFSFIKDETDIDDDIMKETPIIQYASKP